MSGVDLEREIAREQEFVDRVYEQLEVSARSAEALAKEGYGRGRLGHEGGLVERDAMVFQAARRVAMLNAAHEGLVFGRLDLGAEGEARYVGRIGLRDSDRDSLLVDWRAPAAAVFYQATAANPQGVVRRRVLRCVGPRVVAVEDELLDDEADTDLPVVGEGALMAQLSRARDRSMHSIVATIQAEQDEAIRAPARGVVSITGGPGTGKTVVALHRAAYLLYSDRRRYETGGVLVVGPSGVFMRYIERVLPSLGETAVALRSLGEVVDGIRAERHDEPAVADLKGSPRMVELVRRLAREPVPDAPNELSLFYRDDRLHLGPDDLASLRSRLLSRGRRNPARSRVVPALVDLLWRRVEGERARERGLEEFTHTLRSEDRFTDFARAWWPSLEATEVLDWLADPDLLGRLSAGLLTGEEVELLAKSWTRDGTWSVADVALLDELRYLLGDVPPRQEVEEDPDALSLDGDETGSSVTEVTTLADREYAGRPRWSAPTNRVEDDGYAHVLVDEAQDLSPMQWRMVSRRGRTATWTIVGDPAQSSWPQPEQAARARAEALADKTEHAFHLSTNYRNSAEIYAHAAAYAERAGLDADLPRPVRSTGIEPVALRVAERRDGLRQAVAQMAAAVEGTVGVVVPVARRAEVASWVRDWPEVAAEVAGEQARLVVLTGLETKGLEFDGIVVVEPGEIEAESVTGRATLYVVLTRATQRLVTLAGPETAGPETADPETADPETADPT